MSDLSYGRRSISGLGPNEFDATLSRSQIEEQTFQTLTRVLARLNAPIRASLSSTGMSLSHVVLLRILILKGEATPSELATGLTLTNGAVTQLLKKLEAMGLITRSRNEQDRRIVRVKITEKAKRRFSQLHMATLNELNDAFSGWSMTDIEQLHRLLEHLAD